MRPGSGKIKVLLSGLCLFCLMFDAGSVTGVRAEEITVTTAEKMKEACKSKGPFVVVNALAEGDGRKWKELLAKVASGDASWDNDWIGASACLSIGVAYNGFVSFQSLDIAWAEALPKNPVGVLGTLRELNISIAGACSMPFIYPHPSDGKGPGPEFIEAYMKNTLGALETITDDLMKPVAEDCERYLKRSYEGYKNRKEQFPEIGN